MAMKLDTPNIDRRVALAQRRRIHHTRFSVALALARDALGKAAILHETRAADGDTETAAAMREAVVVIQQYVEKEQMP